MAGTAAEVSDGALAAGGRRREGALIEVSRQFLLQRRMIGEPLAAAAYPAFGEKKPELLQARVESTMEAVEETTGATLRLHQLPLRALGASVVAWEQVYARLCCAAIFFLDMRKRISQFNINFISH